ncbi:hypothetical protein ACQUSY_02820 [Microbacterium sp. YY-03]|uniref:hypothetical protein n=1 Tax=Microbacterium sp. YY-03 TaxID=3421636 RepID=UPI003D1836E2
MSIEVLLIPLGMAAVAAIKEANRTDLCTKCMATRVTSVDVLREVLAAMDVTVESSDSALITGTSAWGALTFRQVGNVWLGRVDNASAQETGAMISALDITLGRVMQTKTAQQVVARAESLGFRLVSTTQENGTLNYVFEEA